MIDLRSDTLTVPDAGMREAMAAAKVGDDVYSEDSTVLELQDRVASMFGKEAALFVPSGTMGNQICLAVHGRAGSEVITESNAHIFHYENGAASAIARVQLHGIPSTDGAMALDAIREAVRPPAYYYPRTCLIAVENSHNRHGGTVLSQEYLTGLRETALSLGIPIHCDGARIWNACIASKIDHRTMGSYFDTMSVCLSKGLGAPVGSLILGTRDMIEEARRWRKMLGGGMRQSGILAAGALYALDHVLPMMARDHIRAQQFALGIASVPGIELDRWRVQTNIVAFRTGMDDADFIAGMAARGVRIAPIKAGVMRAVFYHQIAASDAEAAVDAVSQVVARA